jgi:hypothetical protein
MKRIALPCIMLLLAGVISGCGSLELKSRWRTQDVIIDGKNTEWRDSMTALDDKLTSVGLQNDGQYLYVGLVTGNHDLQRRIMRQGITFWFDREGGKGKTFGIHYPLGTGGSGPPRGERSDESAKEPDSWAGNIPVPIGELELYGPGDGDHHRMTIAETGGIEVRTGFDNSVLVYEMKVPLAEDEHHPFAIGAKAGSLVGLGVETASAPSSERPPEGTRGSGGGRGPGGGGRGGRSRGGESGERSAPGSQSEPLKIWAKVQLSALESAQR